MAEQTIEAWKASGLDYFDDSEKRKLPVRGKRNVLITSALPYVNNVPHLGNIIGSVLSADVFSRYCRMRGYQSLYVCGTDEYGTATEMKALQEGVSPQEICDKYHHLHRQIYEWFQIDFEVFGRTSTSHQTEITQQMFLRVHENGFTSTAELEQQYCSHCDKFLADRFVFGTCPHCSYEDARGDQCDKCGKLLNGVDLVNPKCHICSNTPTVRTSSHIFVDLDKLQPEVEEYVEKVITDEHNKWSANAVSIVRSWLKGGLEKRCISRDLKWGIPVPLQGFESKVFYVWFDAPIGYLSITKSLLGEDWVKWWRSPEEEIELFQFLGKDNVAFHGIIFPAVQLATRDGYTKVRSLCATEYLNYEDAKFSKSRGVGVFGDAVSATGIPSDVWRFYLIYMRPESQDTAFNWDDFMLKVNSELNNNLDKFVNSAFTFLYKNFDGVVPEMDLTSVELKLLEDVNRELAGYIHLMEEVHLSRALQKVLAISALGNKYIQDSAPWALMRQGDAVHRKLAGTVIGVCANLAMLISTLLYPFMPSVSRKIREQYNISRPVSLPQHFVQFLKPGHQISEPFSLFANLEPAKITEWKKQFGASQETQEQDQETPKRSKRDLSR